MNYTISQIFNEMYSSWKQGGTVMIAMAILAIVIYYMAMRLFINLRYHNLVKVCDKTINSWVICPEKAPRRVREIIRYTQDGVKSLNDIDNRFREIEELKINKTDCGIYLLNTLVISAPLFGLLGTVIGMLFTFKAIGIGGSSVSEMIAKGISEALVCTQTGMMIAIPGLIMSTILKRNRREFISFFLKLEGISLRYFNLKFKEMTKMPVTQSISGKS